MYFYLYELLLDFLFLGKGYSCGTYKRYEKESSSNVFSPTQLATVFNKTFIVHVVYALTLNREQLFKVKSTSTPFHCYSHLTIQLLMFMVSCLERLTKTMYLLLSFAHSYECCDNFSRIFKFLR